MPTYVAPDRSTFEAADLVDGIPIDPVLPPNFDDTPNERRPRSHQKWWRQPYVMTSPGTIDRRGSGGGGRVTVRCLDGGAWDRSTWWGSFDTIAEAVAFAKAKRIPNYFAVLLEHLVPPREEPL